VTDPADISEISMVPIKAWKVAAGNGYVYATEANVNNPDTLKIYDVSNPSLPVMTASYTLPENAYDIEYANDYVYIANFNSGLRIFNVSDPYAPQEVASVDLLWVLDVEIEGNIAYIASSDWAGGLVSVDISDPENPEILQIYNPGGWFQPFHVGYAWPYAYASDIYGEIYVFDVTDPANMTELESMTLPADITNIYASEQYVYISDGEAGLQILENSLFTGIFEPGQQEANTLDINAYPNPTSGNVTLGFMMKEDGNAQVTIYDMTGRLIVNLANGRHNKGINNMLWNGTDEKGNIVPNGVYFYTVSSGQAHQTGKILMQR